MNCSFRALQDRMEFLESLRNQVCASPFKASGKKVGHDHLVVPGNGCSQRVELQKVPRFCGVVVVANVDLEFLGPLHTVELRGESQTAILDIIISAFSTVARPPSLDAGAHVFSLAVVEVTAEILVMRGGRPDGDGLAAIAVQPIRHRWSCARSCGRSRLSLALAAWLALLLARLLSYCFRTVDGGGSSHIGPETTVGEFEERLHTGPPFMVDLGIVVLWWKLHQDLGREKSAVASLGVEGQRCGELSSRR